MPRPGVEPGLEVPETSVMSFSLPGQTMRQSTELYQRCASDKAGTPADSGEVRLFKQAPLNRREQVALFAVDQIIEAYRKRGQSSACSGDVLIGPGDERYCVHSSHQVAQAAVLFARAKDQIGREVPARRCPRQDHVLFAGKAMLDYRLDRVPCLGRFRSQDRISR